MSQAKRYNTLCALTERNDLDCAYHAAFYLLSFDKELYEIVCKNVSYDGIDFAKIKRSTRDFDERSRFVVDIAHNLFSYYSPCKATPFEISRLGYPLMEQVCNAFYIAAGEVRVEMQTDENSQAKMVLDATPYQKTKNAYRWIEQLQASMGSQQDESNDMER